MRKLVVGVLVALSVSAILLSVFSDQLVVAKPQSKIQFTKTITSSLDPAAGREQFALILAPNKGSLYTGSLTYAASDPVQVIVLHEIARDDSKGQPTWSVDGSTIYGITKLEPPKSADTLEFTGSALGFQSDDPFTVTVSVDGWVRGQPTEVIMQTLDIKERSFSLPQPHVTTTIPMRVGFFEKNSVYYIITDSSNQTVAEKISAHGSDVRFTPKLRWTPASSQDVVYVFTNGVKGEGVYGFQGEVFLSTPAQPEKYSPLRSISFVSWKSGQKAQILDSADEVLKAQKAGRITIANSNITINAPQVAWPGGQLLLKNATQINDAPYDNGQVVEINKDSKKVVFVAHRAWGLDGRAIYYIIPDATPAGPAQAIGVPTVPKLANALSAQVFSDMYQFKNGIKGTGPLGFQQSVLDVITDQSYVPLCRVSIVEWNNAKDASVLETVADINNKKSEGSIHVTLARPLSSDYVMNCPLVSNKG